MSPTGARIGRGLGAASQLAAGLAVTALLLLALELAARLWLGPPPPWADPRALDGAEGAAAAIPGLALAPERNPSPLVTDRFTLWRNQPAARRTQPINPRPFGTSGSWTIETDRRGYRGPERAYPAAHAGRYRILCVGDSVSFGFNVDQRSEYPRALEARLRAEHPAREIEVINAAVPGWSWVQGLRFLEAEGLALRPDLVIAAHGTNDRFWQAARTDLERLPRAGAPAPEMWAPSWLARTGIYRATALAPRALRGADAARPQPSPACLREIRARGSCQRVPLADIAAALRELAGAVRAAGSELLVLNLDFIETDAVAALRPAVQELGLHFVDFAARFRALRAAEEEARARALGLAPAGAVGGLEMGRARRVLFRVVAPPDARGLLSVRGGAYLREGFAYRAPLRDDASGGDERAGDGVHSGFAETPEGVQVLEYQYWLGETPEFEPLPPLPSATGTRLLLVDRDARAPVARFGDLGPMAERTHPNARGQAQIAERLAELIPELRSFSARTSAR